MENQTTREISSHEVGYKIIQELPDDDLKKILFLLISSKDLDSYESLIVRREKMKEHLKHIYAQYDSDLVLETLYAIKKYSLLKRFGCCKHQISFHTSGCIGEFRNFLFSICEELTDDDVSYVEEKLNLQRNQFTSAECLMCWLLVQKPSAILADLRNAFKNDLSRYGNLMQKLENYCGSTSDDGPMVYPVEFSAKDETCGVAVILNQVNFVKFKTRKGSNADRDRLKAVWKKYGFEVILHENLKAEEIGTLFQDLAARNYERPSVFVACLLSHGERGGVIFGSDERTVAVHDLVDMIANCCPSLYGMPKLFFIQACKGDKVQEALVLDSPNSSSYSMDGYALDAKLCIPHMCDTFVAYATVEGYASLRSEKKGSIFIQELTKYLERFGEKEDIDMVMKRVTNSISAMELPVKEEEARALKLPKQMPEYRSTLRGILRFKKPVKKIISYRDLAYQRPTLIG